MKALMGSISVLLTADDNIIWNICISCVSSAFQSNVIKVLAAGYFRGGSSFLGQLFNQHDDAFYWFEPFASLYNKETTAKLIKADPAGYKLYWRSNGAKR